MKRKRNDSATTHSSEKLISNKILCLQNGSHVEVQLNDGKWHSGVVVQCQARKYLVQVEDEQYSIDINSIRPMNINEHKRHNSFEYRPGQFLRNEIKSPTKILSDEKLVLSKSEIQESSDFSSESKNKRFPRTSSTTSCENKKSPFVWKPSTLSTIQTRRSSKNGSLNSVSSEENLSNENLCRNRSLSNPIQQKSNSSNSLTQTSDAVTTSEVLIFRPIIRFVESDKKQEDLRSNLLTSTKINGSRENEIIDQDQLVLSDGKLSDDRDNQYEDLVHVNRKEDEERYSLTQNDPVNELVQITVDSRSSSRTSTDNPYSMHSFESIPSTIEQTNKSETKSSCFLETPPPSLPDIHVTQDSESPSSDKQPIQQFKSKRKQDRPQRKTLPSIIIKQQEHQGKQINGLLDRLIFKQKDEDSTKPSTDLCDPGYLSDEYSEPIVSNKETLSCLDLERFYQQLDENNDQHRSTSDKFILNDDDKTFYQLFHNYIANNLENYQNIDQYRSDYYNDENNQRIRLISNILKRIYAIAFNRNFMTLVEWIPEEIKTHMKLCLNSVQTQSLSRQKRIQTRGKRLVNIAQKGRQHIKTKRFSTNIEKARSTHLNGHSQLIEHESIISNEQQMLLSPSSPLTPISSKLIEQQSNEDLLSPNVNNNQVNLVEEITVLPKERDIYEVIHCSCQSQLDNEFMIQCETCLCWSHCECVGVTANCIPACFKCHFCKKSEDDRRSQCSISSLFNDDPTSFFTVNSLNAEKLTRLSSYFRRLWQLREQISDLKLKSTPILRSLQNAMRSDDLIELSKYVNIQSDRLMMKIKERKIHSENVESVWQTVEDLVDRVCSMNNDDLCLSTNDNRSTLSKCNHSSDLIRILKRHLCDDQEIREIRQSIEDRYKQMIVVINKQIETILEEHQQIERQIQSNFGLFSEEDLNRYLSYERHQSALKTAIERFKS